MRPKTPFVLVAAASVAAVASCTSTDSVTTDELVHQLRNSDITFDGDCSVGILDLLILLGNWGEPWSY